MKKSLSLSLSPLSDPCRRLHPGQVEARAGHWVGGWSSIIFYLISQRQGFSLKWKLIMLCSLPYELSVFPFLYLQWWDYGHTWVSQAFYLGAGI